MAAGPSQSSPQTPRGCALVAQPSPRLSEGLRDWLQTWFEVVIGVADRPSLIEAAHKLQPALVLVDVALAEGDLPALLDTLRRRAPLAFTLLLSDYDERSVDAVALSAGADAIVHKNALPGELGAAVEAMLDGRSAAR